MPTTEMSWAYFFCDNLPNVSECFEKYLCKQVL